MTEQTTSEWGRGAHGKDTDNLYLGVVTFLRDFDLGAQYIQVFSGRDFSQSLPTMTERRRTVSPGLVPQKYIYRCPMRTGSTTSPHSICSPPLSVLNIRCLLQRYSNRLKLEISSSPIVSYTHPRRDTASMRPTRPYLSLQSITGNALPPPEAFSSRRRL